MKPQRFVWEYTLPCSARDAFAWHMQPRAIERLIPPWTHAEVLSASTPDKIGSPVTIRFHAGPFFKDWTVQHTGFMPNTYFIDEQVSGFFRYWKHAHRFEAIDDTHCRLIDEIDYCAPLAWLHSSIEADLKRFFHYRQHVLTEDLRTYAAYPQKKLRILLSGSSGFIGSQLMLFLQLGGHSVTRLCRAQSSGAKEGCIFWNPDTGDIRPADLENFDAVIHLAGESIMGWHWTDKKKAKIFQSRCRDTWILSQVLARLQHPPTTFISASAIGYYGNRGEEILTEQSTPGTGFLADVCKRWEEATASLTPRGTRIVHPRFGAVLSPSGGMLKKMLPAYKLGLGGRMGDGEQFLSWIALDDLLGSLYHILFTQDLQGAVNCTAPQPVKQKDFAQELAQHVHRPLFGNVPKALLQTLAGEMAEELFLSSQRVLPEKLNQTGYHFRFRDVGSFLQSF